MLAVEFQAFLNYLPGCLSLDLKDPVSEVRMVFIHHGTRTSLYTEAVTDKPAVALEVFVMETSAHWEPD